MRLAVGGSRAETILNSSFKLYQLVKTTAVFPKSTNWQRAPDMSLEQMLARTYFQYRTPYSPYSDEHRWSDA